MRFLDKLISFIFNLFVIVLAVAVLLVVIDVVNYPVIDGLLRDYVFNIDYRAIVLSTAILVILAGLKITIFSSALSNTSQKSIMVDTAHGKIQINQDTIENVAKSVIKDYDSIRDVHTRMTKAKNGINMYMMLSVYQNTNIKEVVTKVQDDVKKQIEATTSVIVRNVDVKIKNVPGNPGDKKAKASNPKTKIRIKDNVKDEVLRNKILIACAKNNMMPVGNLPEGFDFEELKALVKDAKTTEDINELASNLYQPQEFGIGAEKEEEKGRSVVAPVILPGKETKKEEESKPVVAPVVIPAQNKSERDNGKRGAAVVAPIVPSNGGNGGSNIPPSNNDKKKKKSGGAWSRFWNKAKVWVMAGIVAAAGWFGIKSCQNNQDKMADKIEQISNKSALDCDAVQSLIDEKYNDGYMDGLQAGKEDCEKSKQKPVVKKKPVKRKVTPVKPAPVILPGDTIKGETVYIPGDTIKGEPVYVPGDTIKGEPVYVPGDTIPVKPKVKPSSVPLEEIDGSIKHEKDYDLNDAKDLDAKGNAVSSKKKGKTSSEGATVNFMDLFNLTKNQKVN